MSFTRFNDDPCRIKKQNQEATGPGRYMLNKPGWGDKPCFMDDPHIRMEQWGANLRTDSINLESDLMGLSINLNRLSNVLVIICASFLTIRLRRIVCFSITSIEILLM